MVKQDDALAQFRNQVGERIKTLREDKRLSGRELAGMADISHEALRSYESGEKTPSLWVAVKISRALRLRSVTGLTR